MANLIVGEALSVGWDGPFFEPFTCPTGKPLILCGNDVAWGTFEALEAWCVTHKIAFVRWCDGYGCQWAAQRVVFTGAGQPAVFAASGDDDVMINEDTVKRLGSIPNIRAYFEAANFAVPPLRVVTAEGRKGGQGGS